MKKKTSIFAFLFTRFNDTADSFRIHMTKILYAHSALCAPSCMHFCAMRPIARAARRRSIDLGSSDERTNSASSGT